MVIIARLSAGVNTFVLTCDFSAFVPFLVKVTWLPGYLRFRNPIYNPIYTLYYYYYIKYIKKEVTR